MIVLIPVSMFRVPYLVARGRPYSRLERRVLEEIASRESVTVQEGATLTSLCKIFQVHERLMVEAVVTLVGARWVAVTSGREATFVLTDEGKVACSSGREPASVTVEPAMPCTLIFERTTGQLTRRGEVLTISEDEARTDLNPCTPLRILRNSLDESQIQKLLPRASGDWVRSIGRARLVTHRRYIAVRVDLAEQIVVGLPRSWYQALSPEILTVARQKQEEDEENARPQPAEHLELTRINKKGISKPSPGSEGDLSNQPAKEYAPTPLAMAQRKRPPQAAASHRKRSLDRSPFVWLNEEQREQKGSRFNSEVVVQAQLLSTVLGRMAHMEMIADVLRSARLHVLIASASATIEGLEALADAIGDAVSKGVRVDVLYGESADSTKSSDIVKLLHKVGYDAAARRGRDLLRPARQATGSGANLLLFDRDGGPIEAAIGNYTWCNPEIASNQVRSAHLTGSSFMAQVARAASGLWAWSNDPDSGDRWRRVADHCQEETALDAIRGNDQANLIDVELIVDDEHAAITDRGFREDSMYIGGFLRQKGGLGAGLRGITVAISPSETEDPAARSVPGLME